MQCGERPAGCEYCWKIEDINRDNISDRVYKSKIYSDKWMENQGFSDSKREINNNDIQYIRK